MKEIIDYINTNDKLTVSKPLPHVTTVRWKMNKVSFYLHITKEEGCYRCGGSTIVTQNGTDSVEVIRVSKLVYSEKEVINLIEDMISSSMELKEFINNKWDYLNH